MKSSTYSPRYMMFYPSGFPIKIHGLFGVGWRLHCLRRLVALVNQWRGERLSPYSVLLRSQYVLDDDLRQPGGGRRMYCLDGGRVDWQNACSMSHESSGCLCLMAREVSSGIE